MHHGSLSSRHSGKGGGGIVEFWECEGWGGGGWLDLPEQSEA